ncbi:MAG: DUF3783 domain-containing protein [Treponematales bacterium]
MDNPVIVLHGFEQEALSKMVDAVRKAAEGTGVEPGSLIFAATTAVNLDWKVKKLIREVRREHGKMTPPQAR